MQNLMKFYSSGKYTQKTLPRLYASQITYVNKQENDTQILVTFDSFKIAHVSLENFKKMMFFCMCLDTHSFASVIILHSYTIISII